MEKTSKIICEDCGIEYGQNQYYLSRVEGQERMPICKYCFERELANSGSIETTFKKYDIPFITELWKEVGGEREENANYTLPRYMKALYLPQYINLRWKDTNWYNKDSEKETSFYDKIVKNLKNEAEKLNSKLSRIREDLEKGSKFVDMNLYISTLKSLRDTLDLINKYDWKLTYLESGSTQERKQISVWEQNHDNQIRNHKVWNVIPDIIEGSGNIIKDSRMLL